MLDDPTIRRCIRFAQGWGFAALAVGNLYAFRATDPGALVRVEDPVGPDCDRWLRDLAFEATMIVAAWGGHPMANERAAAVGELLRESCRAGEGTLYCLGTTRTGCPRHPLYVRGDVRPTPWLVAAEKGSEPWLAMAKLRALAEGT